MSRLRRQAEQADEQADLQSCFTLLFSPFLRCSRFWHFSSLPLVCLGSSFTSTASSEMPRASVPSTASWFSRPTSSGCLRRLNFSTNSVRSTNFMRLDYRARFFGPGRFLSDSGASPGQARGPSRESQGTRPFCSTGDGSTATLSVSGRTVDASQTHLRQSESAALARVRAALVVALLVPKAPCLSQTRRLSAEGAPWVVAAWLLAALPAVAALLEARLAGVRRRVLLMPQRLRCKAVHRHPLSPRLSTSRGREQPVQQISRRRSRGPCRCPQEQECLQPSTAKVCAFSSSNTIQPR